MTRSRAKRLRLTPAWLPVIRDHLVEEGRRQAGRGNLNGTVTERILREFYDEMDVLKNSPLWWVSDDMTALCVDTVANGPLPPLQKYPTDSGLVVFEGGFVVAADTTGGPITVDAVSWEHDYAEMTDGLPGVMFRLYSGDERITMGRLIDRALPIAPVGNINDRNVDQAVITMLRVAFALMSQPSVTAVLEHRWDAREDGPQPGSLRLAPRTKMIVLREPPRATGRDTAGASSRRPLSHRFVVRGFYRDQPYGPDRSLRRRQWIPPYVKGPAGAPLVIKESVRIWRRL